MCNPMSNHVKRHDSNECKVGCSPFAFVVDSGAQCVQLRVEISHTYSCFNVVLIKDPPTMVQMLKWSRLFRKGKPTDFVYCEIQIFK